MTFQTLRVPSQGWSVLMSTDWLTVSVPPAAGLAAAGACWAAGLVVAAEVVVAWPPGPVPVTGGPGAEQAARASVPIVAAMLSAPRCRNWRRVGSRRPPPTGCVMLPAYCALSLVQ